MSVHVNYNTVYFKLSNSQISTTKMYEEKTGKRMTKTIMILIHRYKYKKRNNRNHSTETTVINGSARKKKQ